MSGRDLKNAPLSLQATQLKNSIQNRERRRNQDRAQRVVIHMQAILPSLCLSSGEWWGC